jgi:uncharacterized cupredoxin-like copper-binding protein
MAIALGLTSSRALILGLVFATGPAAAVPKSSQVDWPKAQPVNVVMVEYDFEPSHLIFRRGVAYRLHLENHGKELHEFTAPAFFAAVTLRDPHVLWIGGKQVVVRPGGTADVDFIARRAGHYDLTCADHDWAGMTGDITVQ